MIEIDRHQRQIVIIQYALQGALGCIFKQTIYLFMSCLTRSSEA